jgi:hypothetical protein
MIKIYGIDEFADSRTATDSEMTLKWCGNPAKDFKPSGRFCELQVLENIRLNAFAKAEDYRAILLQRKRENFDNLSNADKLDVLIATFDLISIVEHKPIEVPKLAIKAKETVKKVEFIPVEKPKKQIHNKYLQTNF